MRALAYASFLVMVASCGDESRYLPLGVGAVWKYRVTDGDGTVTMKTSTVDVLEEDRRDEGRVYRISTTNDDEPGVLGLSWQLDTGTAVLRLEERSYNVDRILDGWEVFHPYRIRIDESSDRIRSGATWQERYKETVIKDLSNGSVEETARVDRWEVVDSNDGVNVPMGRLRALRLRRKAVQTSSDKEYWFVRGIGKVKEDGGQEEELVEYTPPPSSTPPM